ncbi:hypothetical protein EVAR_103735_1 [Eumeta japonica]|uniref:Uncharacterized protein n=1 Tax=Eumeta variegata TaxID=151549 RepID=A0A4C1ZHZ2_EUMVA|nr:hypothetical protein EVAR_103735_1 [Eumeta japonica]
MAVPNLPIEAMVARPTVFSNGPVQHQSPANNLANALQLLTVSSLLSEKLPYNGVPVYSKVLGGCGCGAPIAILQRTKLCRCEVSQESVAMTSNENAGEKRQGSGSVVPAYCMIRRQFRAVDFRALYCTVVAVCLLRWVFVAITK